MTGTCLRCGALGEIARHHPSGKAGGVYLHPNFTVPLCLDCHDSADRVRRWAGPERVDFTPPGLLVARLAAFVGWWILDGRELRLPHEVGEELAGTLEGVARALTAEVGA